MKMLFPLLIILLALGACNNKSSKEEKINSTTEKNTATDQADHKTSSVPQEARYGIKSGRVVTVTAMPGGMGQSEATMYFDDYGKVSYTETITKISMKGAPAQPKNYNISEGSYMYSWTEGEKTGTKVNIANLKDVKNLDFEKLSKAMLEDMKIKKGGTETFLGRTCEVTEMNSATMGKGRILTWKNIPMMSDMTTMGMNIKTEVKELEENVSIDPNKFKVPSDVVFTEMSMNLGK